jgi:hypothetical protein
VLICIEGIEGSSLSPFILLIVSSSHRDTTRQHSMASSPAEELDFPRLPSGALDRSRICLKQKQAYEQCHGGSFLDMLKRMGDSLAGGSMEAKCQDEFEAYEDCVAVTVTRLRAMQEAAAKSR